MCLICALIFFALLPRLRKLVRPIYERLNIINPLISGINAVRELNLMQKK